MALGIKLEVVASNSDLTITIDKRSAIILLNLVCFSLTVSDDRNISISFNETGNSVRIGVSTRCDCVMSKMFDVENELPYIFTLLIGMNLAERREFEHTLSHNGKFVTSEVSVPLVNTSDAVLSSTGVSELLINEYFSLFTSVFNN